MSKNIYIEAGVCSLRYNTKPFYEQHKNEDWYYYLFEPNYLSFDNIVKKSKIYNIPNLKIYDKAAWNENCKKEFWLGNRLSKDGREKGRGSASLFSGKGRLGTDKSEVDCIDFGKWVKENFLKEDYIYLRMDIEGSEYVVLPSMIKDGSIDYVNCISLEFHAHKFRGKNRKIFEKIHKELKDFFKNCKNIKIEILEYINRIE